MEDALRRLDKLTQEEARMAAAANLKMTHAVDKRVEGVADTVVAIDDRVKVVDNKVMEVIAGVLITFSQSPKRYMNSEPLRRKGSEGIHATNG